MVGKVSQIWKGVTANRQKQPMEEKYLHFTKDIKEPPARHMQRRAQTLVLKGQYQFKKANCSLIIQECRLLHLEHDLFP